MEELLFSLAKNNGTFGVLFVLSVGVNVYQYKINQKMQNSRLTDWQTTLNTANENAKAIQKSQDANSIMINGIDQALKIILDRMNFKK